MLILCAIPILVNVSNRKTNKLAKLEGTQTKQSTSSVKKLTDSNIGEYVDLGNDPLGIGDTSKNWRVFYTQYNKVYLILADYLPNSTGYAAAAGLQTKDTYSVYLEYSSLNPNTNRVAFRNALNASTWNELANGISNARVYGSPTLQQLRKSWDTVYPDSPMRFEENAYGDVSIASGVDYDNDLYSTSHNSAVDGCVGYWFDTSYPKDDSSVWSFGIYNSGSGHLYKTGYYENNKGLRPVVSLPDTTRFLNTGDGWAVAYAVNLETNGGTINSGDVKSYIPGEEVNLPTDITKTGYTFGGWYEDRECTVGPVESIGATETGAKTYYAKWTEGRYKVKFKDGASIVKEETVTYGGAATAPTLTKIGHTLSWSVDFSNVTSDLTVEARWTPNTYTVTLEEKGGTINSGDITQYTYGVGATLPTSVTKEGYVFDGWYEDVACEVNKVTVIGTTETGNKTYYAKWLEDTDRDGIPDDRDPDTQVGYKVEHYTQNTDLTTYTLRETDTTLTGHLGSTVNAVPRPYTGFTVTTTSNTVASGTVVKDGSLTLKLYYNRNNYIITLNKGEGTINSGNVTQYTYGIGATLPVDVTRQWYVFKGWYEDEACEGTRVTEIGVTETGTKIYYAKWLKDTDGDGIPDIEDNDTQVGYKVEHYTQNTDLTTYTLKETDTTLTGHLGSQVNAEAKEYTGFTVTTTSNTVASGTVVEDGSLTLKLYYNRKTYTITYETNGGTIEDENYPTSYTYGIVVTLPTNVTKTGYTFGGWYENSELTGNVITQIREADVGDKIYYAKWNENGNTPYKVKHYKQTETGYTLANTDTLTGKTGATVTAIPNTYEGYEENVNHEQRVSIGTIAADGTLELKLYYDILTYKVTFKDEDTVLDEQTVNYGTAATAPTPIKTGYVLRWDKEFDNVKSDLTVNAVWKRDTDGDGIPDDEDPETLVKYIVKHYKQQGNTTTYELAETEELKGQLGSEVTANPKTYEGYIENTTASQRVPSGIITGDGSLELILLYDTIKCEVIFKNEGEEVERQIVVYGEGATAPSLTKEGYTLSWDIDFESVTSDITVNAIWTRLGEEQRNYKVEHYVETKEGNYTLRETDILVGDKGDVVIAIPKTYEEYVLDEEHEGTIKEGEIEEGLVLKLYYKYKRFTIIFKDGKEEVGREEVIYGGTAKPPVLTKPGYILSWDKDLNEITSNLTINTVWTKDPNYKDPNSGKDDGKEEKPSILPQTGEETVTLGAIMGLLGIAVIYFVKYKF